VSVDLLQLRGLRALGICGALPEERVRPQPIEVDLDIALDLAKASRSDDLEDTVDYAAIAELVVGVITGEQFTLLERLAGRITEEVLRDTRVQSVAVTVRKLRPPVPQELDTAGVSITRTAFD
jgi:7,8-dihydroneopterin aldolase/epimerase/oxygenase